jgi:hypothetical protein
MSPQLKLFSEGPQFHDRIRRVSINGVMFFSVLDIFKHYSNATNVTQTWRVTEAFLIKQGAITQGWENLGSTKNVELRTHKFEGKGQRSTPVGTLKMIMRIGQVTDFKEWEPMRDWMAQLANERVEETVNPALGIHRAQDRFIAAKIAQGMSEEEASEFLQAVQEGRITRREWTAALKAAVSGAINYGQITNTEYTTLFEKTAKQISEVTGFKTARDGMTKTGRKMLDTVESALEDAFKQHRDLSFKQALELTRGICADFRVSVQSVQARLGVDLATGTPLLTAGNRGAQ